MQLINYLKSYFKSCRRERREFFEIKNDFTLLYVMERKNNWDALISIVDPNWPEEEFKKIKQEIDRHCELSRSNILGEKTPANGITYQETRQSLFGAKTQVTFICFQGEYFLNDAWVIMTKKEDISELFKQKNWKEFIYYTPSKIVRALSYEEAFMTSYYTFSYDFKNESLQNHSMKILFAIREIYPDRWNEDWKNEVFLGDLCVFNRQYDERYDAYLRAYNKVSHPTANLLIHLASCRSCPGVPPVSEEEAKHLLHEAFKLEKSYEAAHALYWLYKDKENSQEAIYWKGVADEAQQNGWQTAEIVPDIIKSFETSSKDS
jgi:hypothetical protein